MHHQQDMPSSGFFSDMSVRQSDGPSRHTNREKYISNTGKISNGSNSSKHFAETNLVNLWGFPGSEQNGKQSSNNALHPVSTQNHLPPRVSRTAQPCAANPISEAPLLRELLFTLDGVAGSLIKHDAVTDAFVIASNVDASYGQQDLVRRISECGWLYNRIQRFIAATKDDRSSGSLLQSLASGLHEHLTEYLHLKATLESQLDRENQHAVANLMPYPESTAPSFTPPSYEADSCDSDLTMTRLRLWTQEPRTRLCFLASLCEACSNKKGGALASEVYSYTLHGDPELVPIARHLLTNVSTTLMHFISLWIYDGQLNDPFQEFFVAANPSVKKIRLWHDKYSLRRQMIPQFITPTQARKILLTGKSINFLHDACGERKSIKEREVIRSSRLKRVESMFDQDRESTFDKMISTVYTQTSRFLLETLIDRYHFLDHLRATRQFLLLGQGDFIQHLMDLLDNDLNQPASQLLQHRLTSTLETAIRDTNAQYEPPEILQRLTVRLLDISADDTGWDVFSLDYRVDGPLATIFTNDCRLMYLRAFNFLWRAKRMEFSLSSLWKHQLIAARLGHDLQIDLEPVLHLAQSLGAEIRHCIQQLQYYINFEVLECAWIALVKQIHAATDLDDVIHAHQGFLSNVITRCLLDTPSRPLITQLRTIFDLIVGFTQLHHEFNTVALNELAARERHAEQVTAAARRSSNLVQGAAEKIRRQDFFQRTVGPFQARVRILASSYREMVVNFIRMLGKHSDPSLRLLSSHLNFNGHYYHHGTGVGISHSLSYRDSPTTSHHLPSDNAETTRS